MNEAQFLFQSPVGPLFLVASKKGLRGVFLKKQSVPMVRGLKASSSETEVLAEAVSQLKEYFARQRTVFEIPLDPIGTEFQKNVWKQLAKVPYGKTRSYQQIAQLLKNDKAYRAVGGATGKNPLCIIVPCHRIISADGSLGGFSGGLPMKRQLLALEGIKVHSSHC